jgi:hypothetical protein
VGEDGVRVPVLGAEAGDRRLDERLWLLQVQLLSFGETGRCNCGSAYADHVAPALLCSAEEIIVV